MLFAALLLPLLPFRLGRVPFRLPVRLWAVRQRFFRTRAGKGLQSAVYSLAQKFPESKVLERGNFSKSPL